MRAIVMISCLAMSCTSSSFARITKPEDPQAASCLARCRSFYAADQDGRFGCIAACPTAETGDGDCAPYIVPGLQHCMSKTKLARGRTVALVGGMLAVAYLAIIAIVIVPGGR